LYQGQRLARARFALSRKLTWMRALLGVVSFLLLFRGETGQASVHPVA